MALWVIRRPWRDPAGREWSPLELAKARGQVWEGSPNLKVVDLLEGKGLLLEKIDAITGYYKGTGGQRAHQPSAVKANRLASNCRNTLRSKLSKPMPSSKARRRPRRTNLR